MSALYWKEEMEPQVSTVDPLDNFIEFLYDGLEGYIYVAAKDPQNPTVWKQEFFYYPTDVARAKSVISAASKKFEVYVAPALYKEPTDGQRSNLKATNVVWTEFDGNAPAEWTEGYEPSLIIQSSGEQNQHVYWRLNEPLHDADAIEDINRRITYNLQADSSAWDATQVLRPPTTYNHKRQKSVCVLSDAGYTYDPSVFDGLAPAPKPTDETAWTLSTLPDPQEVILKYSFPPDVSHVFTKKKEDVNDRSASLMQLAYGCAQMGMKDNEIFVLLLNADDRWEKFKGRKDREKRLAHIITVARNKYPEEEAAEDNEFQTLAFGYQSFLDTEIEIDWAIEPMLMEAGSMLFVGPPGIGKTQVALQVMIHLALGKDWLHYKIKEPKKVCFLSLEMGHGELKKFLELMDTVLNDEERALLQENFIIVPHGESWALNTPEGQERLLGLLDAVEPYGLFVDSVGSSIIGNISSDETVQPLLNFNDRLRNKRGMFVWYLHHTRKFERGSSGQTSQDDVYGNQYLAARATSIYALLPAKGGMIKLRNFKNRLHEKEGDQVLQRNGDNLTFSKITEGVDKILKQMETTPEEPLDDKAGNFNL